MWLLCVCFSVDLNAPTRKDFQDILFTKRSMTQNNVSQGGLYKDHF